LRYLSSTEAPVAADELMAHLALVFLQVLGDDKDSPSTGIRVLLKHMKIAIEITREAHS
jgi:hypothetical protein